MTAHLTKKRKMTVGNVQQDIKQLTYRNNYYYFLKLKTHILFIHQIYPILYLFIMKYIALINDKCIPK